MVDLLVAPKDVVRVEERAYVEQFPDPQHRVFRPDVTVRQSGRGEVGDLGSTVAAAAVVDIPVTPTPPISEEVHEVYLVVRDRQSRSATAVLELPSPANRRPGSDGYRAYGASIWPFYEAPNTSSSSTSRAPASDCTPPSPSR